MLKRLALTVASFMLFMFPLASVGATMPTCRSGDPVVWVNTKSHVYHLKGDKYFGTTKSGAYACRSKAVAEGARASGARASGSGKSAPGIVSAPMSAATPGTDSAGAPASPAPSKKKHHKKTKSSPSPSPTP
jgi:hypothetical protein